MMLQFFFSTLLVICSFIHKIGTKIKSLLIFVNSTLYIHIITMILTLKFYFLMDMNYNNGTKASERNRRYNMSNNSIDCYLFEKKTILQIIKFLKKRNNKNMFIKLIFSAKNSPKILFGGIKQKVMRIIQLYNQLQIVHFMM